MDERLGKSSERGGREHLNQKTQHKSETEQHTLYDIEFCLELQVVFSFHFKFVPHTILRSEAKSLQHRSVNVTITLALCIVFNDSSHIAEHSSIRVIP